MVCTAGTSLVCPVHLVCLVDLVYLVRCFQANNQMNQIDLMNKTGWRTFSAFC
jgi:hypothetical protein